MCPAFVSDDALAIYFESQHGVCSRPQARAAGYSDRTIRRRLAGGVWYEPAPAVLAVAIAGPLDPKGHVMAAHLSIDGSVVSHQSAAWLHGCARDPVEIHLLAPRHIKRPGVCVHTTRHLPPSDVILKPDGIPKTRMARTLADLSASLDPEALESMLDAALRHHKTTVDEVRTNIDSLRRSGRQGLRSLARLLADTHDDADRARSYWESRVLREMKRAGLPLPLVNPPLATDGAVYVIDFLWPDARVVVEFDGWAYHGDRSAFEHDRRRQNRLQLQGWLVLRVTARMLEDDPDSVWDMIAAALAARDPKRSF